MPFGMARYGATILGFINGNPTVINVDSNNFLQTGDLVRITNIVTSTGSQMISRDLLILDINSLQITLNLDSTSLGNYVSGGFMTILKSINPSNTPFLQGNFNNPLIPWPVFNQALGTQIQSFQP